MNATDLFARFLHLVIRKKRMEFLPLIAIVFEDLSNEAHQLKRARVVSAVSLAEPEQGVMKKHIEKLCGSKVTLESSVDPHLIGGFLVKVADQVWDFSARGHLARLKEKLQTAAVR